MRNYYFLRGGGYLHASTPQEFVTALRDMSPNRERNVQEFMEAVAQRCITQSGAYIRTQNADDFLSDLQANDFVFVVPLS